MVKIELETSTLAILSRACFKYFKRANSSSESSSIFNGNDNAF